MNRREIVRDAVEGRATAIVPYHVVFLGPLRQAVQAHFGQEDVNRAVGNYLVWELPPAEVGRVDLAGGEWLDEWGVRWRSTGVNRGHIAAHPLTAPNPALLKRPDFRPAPRAAGLKEACERHNDLYLLAWCGELFERAHFLRGMEDLLVDMHESPRFVHRLLDLCLEHDLDLVQMLAGAPVDAMILSDDYGQQRGPIFSPRHFREFIRPRLKILFDAIRLTGKKVALHSCGDVSAFLPDFVDLGLDILHPIQPDVMDIHRIKAEYGGAICLYGGINARGVVRSGTPQEVRSAVAREKERLARGGRFILAPTLDLTHDVPLQNVLAFLEAARA